MEYKVCGDVVAVRLDKDDMISQSLTLVAEKEKISFATVSGIGATDDFEVGVFDLEKSDYDHIKYKGNHEILSLVGNFTLKDGKPYLHLHITCAGKNGKIVGGHLFDGHISLTAEIFLHVLKGEPTRKFDESLRINRISFK